MTQPILVYLHKVVHRKLRRPYPKFITNFKQSLIYKSFVLLFHLIFKRNTTMIRRQGEIDYL